MKKLYTMIMLHKIQFRLLSLPKRAIQNPTCFHISATNQISDDPHQRKSLKEPEILDTSEIFSSKEIKRQRRLQQCICIQPGNDLDKTKSNPEELISSRIGRIHRLSRNVMQSGSHNTLSWRLDFGDKLRWENPLMGWCSNGDPVSNLVVMFKSKEDAIRYCEVNGFDYYVQELPQVARMKKKTYGDNFSWNKKTRVSTK